MSQDNTPSETVSNRAESQPTASTILPRQAVFIVIVLSLFAVEPAAAQTNASVVRHRSSDTISIIHDI